MLCIVCKRSSDRRVADRDIYHSSFYLHKIYERSAYIFKTSGLHITSDLKRKGRFPPSPNDITHTIWFELDKLINIFNYGIPNEYNWGNPMLKKLISIKLISNIFKILGLAFNGRIEDRLTRAPQIFAATTRLHPDVFGFRDILRGGKNIKQLSKPKKPSVKPKKPSVKPKKPTVKPKKPSVKPKKPSVKPKKPANM